LITTNAEIKLERKISENLFLLSAKLEKYREWFPGMFLQISLTPKSASEPWLDSRAFSFASWGSEQAKILVRREGDFTSTLISKSMSGFVTSVRYPFGRFLLTSRKDKVFIAGGAGISVFLSYIDYVNTLKDMEENVDIFHSAKRESEGIKQIYWNKFPKKMKLSQYITGRSESNYTGRLSIECIKNDLLTPNDHEFYVCGPTEFNIYWLENLKRFGILPNLEQWIN
jgi:NAD(P)H-flavin reductase